MLQRVTTLLSLFLFVGLTYGQQTEFILDVPTSSEFKDPYAVGVQSGVRAVAGPFDLDGDGLMEILATDYTGGGRVHVIENRGPDTWEWVYSTPWLDSTATTSFNARYAYGANASADLDGDGRGEIILPTGRNFGVTSPYTQQGLYIFEHTGIDDDYGLVPSSILALEDRVYIQASIEVEDIDGDGVQELIFPNNASNNDLDKWYIYSVAGDIGSGFEVWEEEFGQPSRPDHGGGSPWAFYTPDLDGDGQDELLMHSWNDYNFTVGRVLGANSYEAPGNQNIQREDATVNDDGISYDAVAYTGGTVIDINQDGDDEVYFTESLGGGPDDFTLTLVNHEAGEDPMILTRDQVIVDLLPEGFIWGITSGDLDGDTHPEILGVGWGYPGSDFGAGTPSSFVRVAEFIGGPGADPEDPANYTIENINTGSDVDAANFDTIHQVAQDGTETTYYEDPSGSFGFRAAYLGDADGDGFNEMAIGFQGVRDSVMVYDETWNETDQAFERTLRETTVAAARPFVRILSGDGLAVSVENTRIVIPSDYKLHDNYPNPFNPSTLISFSLPLDKTISVRVYDVSGRLVKTLVNDQRFSQGTHEVNWNGTDDSGAQVSSGTYLYSLEYGNFRQTKTMVLIK